MKNKTALRCVNPVSILLLFGILLSAGCSFSFEQDPEETVTVEVSGVTNDDDRDEVSETLKGMTDGSSHILHSSWSGNTVTYSLSPVKDVDAFSKKINFGKVTEVKDRTVKVDFVK